MRPRGGNGHNSPIYINEADIDLADRKYAPTFASTTLCHPKMVAP